MRKFTASLLGLLLVMVACNKQDAKLPPDDQQVETTITQRNCAAAEMLEQQLAADPVFRKRMEDLEVLTQKAIKDPKAYRLVNGVIEIPVVVHVLYATAKENISDAQVASQIEVLNEDFNNTNKDAVLVPTEFKDEQASVGVRFVLDRTIRKATTVKSWPANDAMKKSSYGGSDPVDPSTYLNMWVCNLGQDLLGYAQFPGGNPATDGVVVLYSAFGRKGTLIKTYNKGRTATHEVGHWMNLRHIWGDAPCGNDLVDDTPLAATYNWGCPSYPKRSTCRGNMNEMTMNYMDYTDDACMYMFTNQQKLRMLAVFASSGPRSAMGR